MNKIVFINIDNIGLSCKILRHPLEKNCSKFIAWLALSALQCGQKRSINFVAIYFKALPSKHFNILPLQEISMTLKCYIVW